MHKQLIVLSLILVLRLLTKFPAAENALSASIGVGETLANAIQRFSTLSDRSPVRSKWLTSSGNVLFHTLTGGVIVFCNETNFLSALWFLHEFSMQILRCRTMNSTQFFRFISLNYETGKSRDPGHFFREINPGKMTRDPGENGIPGSRERNPNLEPLD